MPSEKKSETIRPSFPSEKNVNNVNNIRPSLLSERKSAVQKSRPSILSKEISFLQQKSLQSIESIINKTNSSKRKLSKIDQDLEIIEQHNKKEALTAEEREALKN